MGTPNELVDPNIQPSLSSAIEFGVDLRFAKNRLGLSVTYYDESKTNEILSVSVAGASGFTTKKINAGQIDRSGVEIQLEAKPIASKDFSWDDYLKLGARASLDWIHAEHEAPVNVAGYCVGGALASIKAWVDHSGDTICFGFTEGITANVVIQVNKTDVPTATKQDLIYLPRTGLSYNPTEILTDRSGRMWNMALGRVATV